MMLLLKNAEGKDDKFYKQTLKRFSFSGLKEINLGTSQTGSDAGFGPILSKQVISDAYMIIKRGCVQPELFQLVCLFEENVGADRLSDMIGTIIKDDIRKYTKRINKDLKIDNKHYPNIKFNDGIAINTYKNCELWYLPREILHELPIARSWDQIEGVITENENIRREVNETVGKKWQTMSAANKKHYLKDNIFMDPSKCERVINGYKDESIRPYVLENNIDYFVEKVFKKMKDDGTFNYLEHNDLSEINSFDGALKILKIFKKWVEDNKGWDEVLKGTTNKREKSVQKLIQLSGLYYCEANNLDLSFEVNDGPGPVDMKVSRGNDKTVIEVKLNTNGKYLQGFTDQIEEYAKAENTNNRIYVYVIVEDHEVRDKKIREKHDSMLLMGDNPPYLFVIDSRKQSSASLPNLFEDNGLELTDLILDDEDINI